MKNLLAFFALLLTPLYAAAQPVDRGEVQLERKGGSFVAQMRGSVSSASPDHWILPLVEGTLVLVAEVEGVGSSFEIIVPDGSDTIKPVSIFARNVRFNAPVTGDYVIVVSPATEFTGGDTSMETLYSMSMTVSRFP